MFCGIKLPEYIHPYLPNARIPRKAKHLARDSLIIIVISPPPLGEGRGGALFYFTRAPLAPYLPPMMI